MGLDFPDGPRVLSDFSVDGKQSDAFHAGLRNEHAIERVFVDRRQIADRCGLRAGDRQFEIAVREHKSECGASTYSTQAKVTEKRLSKSVNDRFGVKREAAKSAFSAAGVNL